MEHLCIMVYAFTNTAVLKCVSLHSNAQVAQ